MPKKSKSIRRHLNKVLLMFRYRLVRLSIFEQTLIQRFGENGSFTFVQIGANDGISFDDLYHFVTRRKCKGCVVEPVSDYFKTLKSNYAPYPDIIPVNVGVHATERSARIYNVNSEYSATLPDWSSGIASLDPNHHRRLGISEDKIISEEIQCVHLMKLFETFSIDKLDLLQIDAEGYDAAVIRMIDFDRIRPAIIKFEHVNLDESEVAATRSLLVSNGYTLRKDRNDTIATSYVSFPVK